MSAEQASRRPRRLPARVRWVERAWRWNPWAPATLRRALSVPGQINPRECLLLLRLAAEAPAGDGAIVEIGSYRGRSTVCLALGAKPGATVHAVDPHRDFVGVMGGVYGPADDRALTTNLRRCGVAERVRRWRMPSVEAAARWRGPIALLWIDGDHRPRAVRADLDAWTPHLRPTGRLALHDALRPGLGPTAEVARLLDTGGWRRESGAGDIVVLRKVSRGMS